MGVFRRIFGSYSDRQIKKLKKIADAVEALAPRFAAMSNEQCGFPVENDCFAEIEYTGEMQENDKQYYVASLRKLATDGAIDGNEMSSFETLKFVKVRKISDEIIML